MNTRTPSTEHKKKKDELFRERPSIKLANFIKDDYLSGAYTIEQLAIKYDYPTDVIRSLCNEAKKEYTMPAPAKPNKRGRKPKIAEEVLIDYWNRGLKIAEIAEKIGTTPSYVAVRISLIRKRNPAIGFRRPRRGATDPSSNESARHDDEARYNDEARRNDT